MSIRDLGVYLAVMLLIRVGQMLLLAGSVRSKNAAGASVRGLLDLAVVVLTIWAIGGLFMPSVMLRADLSPTRDWLSFRNAFGGDGGYGMLFVPVLMIATIAPLGATAERVRVLPLLIFSAAAALLLPLVARIGLTMESGVFQGERRLLIAVIGGGAAALVLAWIAGPRKGKFNRDLSVNFVPGHAVVFQFVGLLLLTAGFCAATVNGIHTLLGLCSGALAGAAFGKVRFGKIDAGLMVAASLGALAAGGLAGVQTGVTSSWLGNGGAPAVIAGAIAGVAVPWAVMFVETRPRIDDAAGFGVAYVAGGTIGVLVAALTRHAGTFGAYLQYAGVDLIVYVLAASVFAGVAFALGKFFAGRGQFRVSEAVEYDGVDLSDLDVNAYPDFQQTMIKSHHLRQL